MTTLFPETDLRADSPKLSWLRRHRLSTRKEDLPRWNSGPRDSEPWVCENAGGTYRGTGTTEELACIDYSLNHKIRHWTVEQWEDDCSALAKMEFEVQADRFTQRNNSL